MQFVHGRVDFIVMENRQCLGGVFYSDGFVHRSSDKVSVHECQFHGSGASTRGCISTGWIS